MLRVFRKCRQQRIARAVGKVRGRADCEQQHGEEHGYVAAHSVPQPRVEDSCGYRDNATDGNDDSEALAQFFPEVLHGLPRLAGRLQRRCDVRQERATRLSAGVLCLAASDLRNCRGWNTRERPQRIELLQRQRLQGRADLGNGRDFEVHDCKVTASGLILSTAFGEIYLPKPVDIVEPHPVGCCHALNGSVLGVAMNTTTQYAAIAAEIFDTQAPSIGAYWAAQGGIYIGLAAADGALPQGHLVLSTITAAKRLTWSEAVAWAAAQRVDSHTDLRLPTRFEAALIYANGRSHVDQDRWHWTGTPHKGNASCAWYCDFSTGGQSHSYKGNSIVARAVRRFVL